MAVPKEFKKSLEAWLSGLIFMETPKKRVTRTSLGKITIPDPTLYLAKCDYLLGAVEISLLGLDGSDCRWEYVASPDVDSLLTLTRLPARKETKELAEQLLCGNLTEVHNQEMDRLQQSLPVAGPKINADQD